MNHVEKSTDVAVPVRTAYNQWTQFEEFPLFMEGVKEVRQLDDKHLFWRAEIAGKEVHWDAEITHQEPDKSIGWRSTSGAANEGLVTFRSLGPDQTRVTLRLQWEPEGLEQKAGSWMGIVSKRISGDLERFKKFIEERGRETGAWRGEIAGGQVKKPGTMQAGF